MYRQVKIMKHAMTDANYTISTKQVKLQHEKKPASNLISMQTVGFDQTSNLLRIALRKNNFFIGKKP